MFGFLFHSFIHYSRSVHVIIIHYHHLSIQRCLILTDCVKCCDTHMIQKCRTRVYNFAVGVIAYVQAL